MEHALEVTYDRPLIRRALNRFMVKIGRADALPIYGTRAERWCARSLQRYTA